MPVNTGDSQLLNFTVHYVNAHTGVALHVSPDGEFVLETDLLTPLDGLTLRNELIKVLSFLPKDKGETTNGI